MRCAVSGILVSSRSRCPAVRTSSAQSRVGYEWPVYGGDPGATRYAALADINRETVEDAAGRVDVEAGRTRAAGIRHAARHVPEHAADDR